MTILTEFDYVIQAPGVCFPMTVDESFWLFLGTLYSVTAWFV
jgi:hypothetical protein